MENERPIEKLLRRYAKKRRDDAGTPPELHPATRRLLQGEVARRNPQGRSADAGRRAGFWPRWALIMGVGISLALVVALFFPTLSRPKLQSAKLAALNQPAERRGLDSDASFEDKAKAPEAPAVSLSSPQPAAPPASAAPETEFAKASGASGGVYPVNVAGYVNATNAVLPVGGEAASESPALPVGGTITTGGQTVAPSADVPTATVWPNGAVNATGGFKFTNNLAFAGESSQAIPALQNNLSQTFRNNANAGEDRTGASPANDVLNNFNCEQDGDRLLVVDGDGSTYAGSIEVAQPMAAATRAPRAAQVDAITSQVPQNYFFRVAGTNRTLNANVIFTGNLMLQAGANQTQTVNPANQAQNGVPQQSFPVLQNATINGRARVGDQIVVEVNAVPVR